ncbi:unnamed protein product [Urochloa decumbens]|uniref:MADS-box domain-containing protein n=1 Tax=Urochloa decumbens TaxID=240449 RepID=A0ABC9E971_9POAL
MVKGIEAQCRRRFSRRRSTLFSRARRLSEDFGAHVAVVAFSPSGVPHAFGGPTVDSVLCAYLPGPAAGLPSASRFPGCPRAETVGEAAARVAGMRRQVEETEALVASEYALLAAAAKKIKAIQASTGKRNWWEVDVDTLGEEELPVFTKALEMLRADVRRRVDAMVSARQPLLQCKK